MTEVENKIWHWHPVWFLGRQPNSGLQQTKSQCAPDVLEWLSFDVPQLKAGTGKFRDASIINTSANQINTTDLKRWLNKARDIQWDYKNLIKRKGKLERLK